MILKNKLQNEKKTYNSYDIYNITIFLFIDNSSNEDPR